MIIFKDPEKQLNLHPLVITVVLTANEKKKYAKMIARWNENPLFHCGLFQFNIVTRTHYHSAELSEQLAHEIDCCNVMARLFDKVGQEAFCYVFRQLPFGKSDEYIEKQLFIFIKTICRANLHRFLFLNSCHPFWSPERTATIDFLSQAIENVIKTFPRRQRILLKNKKEMLQRWHLENEKAKQWDKECQSAPLKLSDTEEEHKPGHADFLINSPIFPSDEGDSYVVKDSYNCEHNRHVTRPALAFPSLAEDYSLVMSELQGEKAKEAMKRLMSVVESVYDTASVEDSGKIATGAVNRRREDFLRNDIASRPNEHTKQWLFNFNIEVKKIITSITKTGRRKRSYGVEFTIDGRPTQVYFGGTDATMIFISSLIKQVAGSRFYRKYMLLPLQEGSIFSRDTMIDWLETLYKTLYPGARTSFDEWYRRMREDPHIISQGKSTCVRKVTKALQENGNGSAVPYCVLQSREDREGLFYALNLPFMANVILPPELEKLLAG